jgi:hypothetical protein
MSSSQQDYLSQGDTATLDRSHEAQISATLTEDEADGGAKDSKQTRSWQFWLTMLALFLGMFVANLDATIVGKLADIHVLK